MTDVEYRSMKYATETLKHTFNNLKIKSFFLLLFCFSLNSNLLHAQNFPPEAKHFLDSLNRVVKTTRQDTVKVFTLVQIANFYSDVNADTAMVICRRAEKISKKIGYNYGVAMTYGVMGYIFEAKNEFDQALKHYTEALKLLRELRNKGGEGIMLVSIGHVLIGRGSDVEAMEYFLKAMKIAEKIDDTSLYVACVHYISMILQSQGEGERALVYLFKEVRITKKIGDKRMYAFAMAGIGNVKDKKLSGYVKNNNAPYDTVLKLRDEVLWYYAKSKGTFEELQMEKEALGCERQTGMVYKYWSDYLEKNNGNPETVKGFRNTALDFLLKSEEAERKNPLLREGEWKILDIAEIYLSLGKTDLAEKYALNSYSSSKKINSIVSFQNAVNLLYKIYAKQGKYEKALKMYERSVALKDSLSNLETQKEVLKKEFEYEKEKKEQENKQLKSANQIQQLSLERNRFALYGIGIIALLIIGGAVLLIRISRIRMSQRSVQLEQKLLRSQMNPHFIFNALTAIQGFVYKNEPRETGRFLSSFSILMRSILENSKEEYIPLEEEITWLENYVNLQQLRFTDGLNIQVNIDEELNLGGTFIPPMLIQPFVENAIEHGFKDKESQKLIRIDFILETDFLVISVNDNGQGFEKDKPQTQGKHISRAVQITQDRLNLLNKRKKSKIEFTIDSVPGEGTTVRFAVPLVKD